MVNSLIACLSRSKPLLLNLPHRGTSPRLARRQTAYYLENKQAGVSLLGHSGQKTSFSGGSIIVKQNGHAVLTVTLAGGKEENYLITLRECMS